MKNSTRLATGMLAAALCCDEAVADGGLGLAGLFCHESDSRDNFFSPHAGYRYEIEHLWYRDFLGSDIEYQLTSFSGLNYCNLTDSFRLALRVGAEYADTDGLLPPFATPGIELRGLPAPIERRIVLQISRMARAGLPGAAGSAT